MAKIADDIRLGTITYLPTKECAVIVRRLKVYDYLIGCVQVLYGREQGEFQVDIIAMLILVHTCTLLSFPSLTLICILIQSRRLISRTALSFVK
jgi:hypothetical protein